MNCEVCNGTGESSYGSELWETHKCGKCEGSGKEGFKRKFTVTKNGGNNEKTYIVINTDEPYADEIIEIMKRYGHWG